MDNKVAPKRKLVVVVRKKEEVKPNPYENCDGKICGKGKHVCSGRWVCPHNSLGGKFPHLVKEWSEDNEKSPFDYLPGSTKRVLWVCSRNKNCKCHTWETTIQLRTRKERPTGCPFCFGCRVCEHDNLATRFPHLALEWHPDNPLPMSSYTPFTDVKVKWICSKNKNCTCHIWEACIKSRSSQDKGCPYCCGSRVCEHDNLATRFPHLALEWHPDNPLPMSSYPPFTNKKVKWICSKNKNCKCHIWEASITCRSHLNSGCPFCHGNKVCKHDNLATRYNYLLPEWHPDNPLPMTSYAPFSGEKVKWICSENHTWETIISHRTGKMKSGCPHCSKSRKYSKAQMEWLKYVEQEENISIRNALSSEGEYYIPGVGKVDGYCEETNTCYEFHGDYWHGNPLLYEYDEINQVNKKTFGELYKKTIERDQRIRDAGYNLIVKWETDIAGLNI